MTPLPRLMVAPNGARRGKEDHPALPLTDAELIATAMACQDAGADGIHVHIRDAKGAHEVDVGHYREILAQLHDAVPDMYHQVTSESAGRYSGAEQRDIMHELKPRFVSVAMREMIRDPSDKAPARDFYEWAKGYDVEIQHILYSPDEVQQFVAALEAGNIPGNNHLIQFVQGSYANGSNGSAPLPDYIAALNQVDGMTFDWMLCAFGTAETESLAQAARCGGKARVGFENSLWNRDGSLADDNAMRVREVDMAIRNASLGVDA